MKFHFSNFIRQLPQFQVSDDKVQDIVGKLFEPSIFRV